MNERVRKYIDGTKQRNANYAKLVKKMTPLQMPWIAMLKAFAIGGAVCLLGQGIKDVSGIIFPKLDGEKLGCISSMVLIFLTCLLTGLGVFDKVAKIGGGGTFLPITGFANSISSAAMEFRSEGMIFGLASKFFSIAGAVVINSIVMSSAVALIYYILISCGVSV